jgi:integrase/recombinase XerC
MTIDTDTREGPKAALSPEGTEAVATYGRYLREHEDLATPTLRNYLSDLRHFGIWYETSYMESRAEGVSFDPADVTTPAITAYRSWMQHQARLKPATINRRLVTLNRYFAWALGQGRISRDPAKPVKQVPVVGASPRHLSDREENALLTAVQRYGSLRDRTLIVLALHTGLRAGELVSLRREHVDRKERSGAVRVYGKRNKYREVPLNSTARETLREYNATLGEDPWLFPNRRGGHISAQQLGEIVARYARLARVDDVSPHDLRHRFGYRMAEGVPLHRLAQLMGHDSLDTTMLYVRGTKADLQAAVEGIAWR